MPPPLQFVRSRISAPSLAPLAVYVVGFVILLFQILQHTQGHFTYSLDDPYIHLALAERIRHGLYGLNAGEPASPSSSIVWPFLFVPFAGTALMTYAPLLLNFVLGCGVAWLLGTMMDRAMGRTAGRASRLAGALLAVLLVFGLNLLGLTFTGLEQLLELLLCVGCAELCIYAGQGKPIPAWTLAAATLLPSVRYEGLLITLAAVWVLWFAGRQRAAVLVLVLSLAPVGLFSLFLLHLKLPPVPISVVIKGGTVLLTGGSVHGLLLIAKGAVKTAFLEPERAAVLALTILSLVLLAMHFRSVRWRAVLVALSVVGVVQTWVGPFDWLFRYEMYTIGFITPVLLTFALDRDRNVEGSTRSALERRAAIAPIAASFAVASGLVFVYAPALAATVNAAQSVWREQAQLARITHDVYRGPVAINDLGLVAYGRDPHAYVLDLYGLGSAEVYRRRIQHTLWNHMADVTSEHHIGLVAIYPEWQKSIPAVWNPIAKLCSEDMRYGPAFPRVMLYSTPDSDRAALLEALSRFKATLGEGTQLEIEPADTSPVCQ